jgi:hypothetical protein
MVTTHCWDPGSCVGLDRLLRHITLTSHRSASYRVFLAELSTPSTQRRSPFIYGHQIFPIEAQRFPDLAR